MGWLLEGRCRDNWIRKVNSVAVQDNIALLLLDGFRRDEKVETHADFRFSYPFDLSVYFQMVAVQHNQRAPHKGSQGFVGRVGKTDAGFVDIEHFEFMGGYFQNSSLGGFVNDPNKGAWALKNLPLISIRLWYRCQPWTGVIGSIKSNGYKIEIIGWF